MSRLAGEVAVGIHTFGMLTVFVNTRSPVSETSGPVRRADRSA